MYYLELKLLQLLNIFNFYGLYLYPFSLTCLIFSSESVYFFQNYILYKMVSKNLEIILNKHFVPSHLQRIWNSFFLIPQEFKLREGESKKLKNGKRKEIMSLRVRNRSNVNNYCTGK